MAIQDGWEDVFRTWARPPSETEQDRSDNAERMIREAIRNDAVLSKRNIDVFAQGSYKHNTNIKQDSDVDICIRYMDTFFYDLPDQSVGPERFGIEPSVYTLLEFKNAVENALVNKFGRKSVTRGNRAFDIHENSYRVNADVVACFEYRLYTGSFVGGVAQYDSGTELHPDKGGRIINWPQQNYENGVWKNKQTGTRYKYIVRILKRLRNYMKENKVQAANDIASFLIECLAWNVPNDSYCSDSYISNVRSVLAHLFNETLTDEKCAKWGEVNELKYLFNACHRGGLRRSIGFHRDNCSINFMFNCGDIFLG